jgi:hypothetical protein
MQMSVKEALVKLQYQVLWLQASTVSFSKSSDGQVRMMFESCYVALLFVVFSGDIITSTVQ